VATTILVVDDEPVLRDMLVEKLSRAGYKVLAASGGHEAFEVIKANKIHAVVTDVRMAQGNGLELLERTKAYDKSIPVILMSGFADFTREGAIEKGATEFLEKPAGVLSIVEKLSEIVPS